MEIWNLENLWAYNQLITFSKIITTFWHGYVAKNTNSLQSIRTAKLSVFITILEAIIWIFYILTLYILILSLCWTAHALHTRTLQPFCFWEKNCQDGGNNLTILLLFKLYNYFSYFCKTISYFYVLIIWVLNDIHWRRWNISDDLKVIKLTRGERYSSICWS